MINVEKNRYEIPTSSIKQARGLGQIPIRHDSSGAQEVPVYVARRPVLDRRINRIRDLLRRNQE